ncbi:MAG: DUF1127 domain-containing protein [Sedimenticola sp.]
MTDTVVEFVAAGNAQKSGHFVGFLTGLLGRLQAWHTHQKTVQALSQLPDYLLEDVGVERDLISECVSEQSQSRAAADVVMLDQNIVEVVILNISRHTAHAA